MQLERHTRRVRLLDQIQQSLEEQDLSDFDWRRRSCGIDEADSFWSLRTLQQVREHRYQRASIR